MKRGGEGAYLGVLNGEEYETLVIGLEDRLIGITSDGRVTDESITSVSLEFVYFRLLDIDGGSVGSSGELVSEGSRLGEVEFVERGGSDFGRSFLNSGDHLEENKECRR